MALSKEDRLVTALRNFIDNDVEQFKELTEKVIKDYIRKTSRL